MATRRYYLTTLLVVGASAVAIAAAPTAIAAPGANPGGDYSGYDAANPGAAAIPTPPWGRASQPGIAPGSPTSHALPIVNASGDPSRQR